jgi:hypothetical protein
MLIGPGQGRGVSSKGGPAPPTPIKTTCSFSLSIPTNLPSGNESTIVVEGEMLSNPAAIDGPYKMFGRLDENPNPPTQVPNGGSHKSRELPGAGTVVVV